MTLKLALATLLADLPGLAAATLPEGDALSDVVVTARRLEERAWELPLAIDVFTTGALRDSGTVSLSGVAGLSPGFSFEPQFGASGGAATLRGQSQPTASGDNVAVFVDGVYQPNRSVIDLEFLDVERVELLRGPQSSLFGHSAFAGALHVISRKPTQELSRGWTLEGGSDGWLGTQAFVSGPLGSSGWLGRVAASYRRADGTIEDASAGSSLGGFARRAFVGTITRDAASSGDWTGSLSVRFGSNSAEHPAVASLYGTDFNCGSRDAASGLWSYYCGRAPIARTFDLSDGLPDSTSHVTQVSIRLAAPLAGMRLELDSSAYSAHASVIRDFDASSTGQLFGVCVFDQSCLGSSNQPPMVDRLTLVEQILTQRPDARQVSHELRLRSADPGVLDWLVGVVHFDTREQTLTGIGAERGLLAANERLVAPLPGSPEIAGPVSRINRALVDDPTTTQVEQFRSNLHGRTFAVYAALDWRPTSQLALRSEVRGTWERLKLDSVTANFLPSFGKAIPAPRFHDVTPRISAEYSWSESLRTYLSAAKGSRSGGVNPLPGLVAQEQTFAPESNWTYEAGLKLASRRVMREFRATAYYIDWRDTQIRGFSTTPGISNLITLNTAGVMTKGIEASLTLRPVPWLRADFDYSRVDARFRRGSDDPSAGDICGLSASSSTSTFCTIGAPRSPSPNSPDLVPWLDGRVPARVPRTSWHGALILEPQPRASAWQFMLRADLSRQDAMYDRGVNGFSFGARTLLDVRLRARRGPWSVEIWARNLANDHYIRSVTSRQAQFFPTSPRPLDFIYGDGRRIGVTLHFAD
ncbi:MAG TPA: TonB-dependent receptor [Steroidobacteraceae bacterium]|nr:TonB-dependent receptor [Steroidobacteraceae bacterium]